MSNDGHCVVCEAEKDIWRSVGEITRAVLRAYVEGIEDEGVAQRDRFCLTHRAAFDAMVRAGEAPGWPPK